MACNRRKSVSFIDRNLYIKIDKRRFFFSRGRIVLNIFALSEALDNHKHLKSYTGTDVDVCDH